MNDIQENMTPIRVQPEDNGMRLDNYLGSIAREIGTRGAKRLAADGCIRVNGRTRPAHYRVRIGDSITIEKAEQHMVAPPDITRSIRLAALSQDYAVFMKPEGLHSAHISGSKHASLEDLLPTLWPQLVNEYNTQSTLPPQNLPPIVQEAMRLLPPATAFTPEPMDANTVPTLLTRLDADTSGLMLAARTPRIANTFRDIEDTGAVSKYYLALVYGMVAAPLLLNAPLDTDSRRKTRVLPDVEQNYTRHTHITPVGDAAPLLPAGFPQASLVLARITRGARHQIRAHLAHAGYPIIGDTLYGPETTPADLPQKQEGTPRLFLHHACLALPDWSTTWMPDWN